jgi:XTP/dITP diphosphohydrolase
LATEWVLASRNPGKAREFDAMLSPYDVRVVPMFVGGEEVVPETGSTYLDNALRKARFAVEKFSRPALADDSGIEVDALDGAPGLYSARYVSDDPAENLRAVLVKLMGVPWELRTARMRSVVVLVTPSGRVFQGEGVIEGHMAMVPRGANGFGYDPGFVASDGRTLAEWSAAEKNAASHRAKALRQLVSHWRAATRQ